MSGYALAVGIVEPHHVDLLFQLDLLTAVPGTSPWRYRFDVESDVSEALVELDGAVNDSGPHIEE